jgi:hypothetical protein
MIFHQSNVINLLHFIVDEVRIYNPNPADDDELGARKLIGDCRPDCECGWGIADCVVDYMCCAKDADSTDPLVDQECGKQDTDFRNNHLTNLSNSLAKMYWYVSASSWWTGGSIRIMLNTRSLTPLTSCCDRCDKGWCYSCR